MRQKKKFSYKEWVRTYQTQAAAFFLLSKNYPLKIVWANFQDVFPEGIPEEFHVPKIAKKEDVSRQKARKSKDKRKVVVPSLRMIASRARRIRKTWVKDDNQTLVD